MKGQQKPGAPVVGFNHNIPYKGRTFHVQTEDSGPQHAHVITHVFLGGNILASTKSLYADLVAEFEGSELFAAVRKRMEEQHKAMMRELLAGRHDAEIARRSGGGVYEPGVLASGEKAPGLLVGGSLATPATPATRPPAPAAAPARAPVAPTPTVTPTPVPSPRRPPAPTTARPTPPPTPRPKTESASSPASPPTSPTFPTTLPASQPAPRNDAPLFGDGLISHRRLDEVILNYLATDPEAAGKDRSR